MANHLFPQYSNVLLLSLTSCWTWFQSWLFNTKTPFYEHPDWSPLPWYFGFLCWSAFLMAGWTLYMTSSSYHLSFPGQYVLAFVYIFLQAPLSFLADFMNMDSDSVWHVLDRIGALTCTGLEVWRILCLWHRSSATALLYVGITITGLSCYGQSQRAQAELDRQGFVFWHNMWHLYPILTSTQILYDHYMLGPHTNCGKKKL